MTGSTFALLMYRMTVARSWPSDSRSQKKHSMYADTAFCTEHDATSGNCVRSSARPRKLWVAVHMMEVSCYWRLAKRLLYNCKHQ